MRYRRLTALLSGLSVLWLILGQGSPSCNTSAANANSVSANLHAEMDQQSGKDKHHQKPCESAAIVCCQAMTSCGVPAAVSEATSQNDLLIESRDVPPAFLDMALDRITPPEPPPPKAYNTH